jgi:hypothetical protein
LSQFTSVGDSGEDDKPNDGPTRRYKDKLKAIFAGRPYDSVPTLQAEVMTAIQEFREDRRNRP